ETVERGHELAAREVAARPEDDDGGGLGCALEVRAGTQRIRDWRIHARPRFHHEPTRHRAVGILNPAGPGVKIQGGSSAEHPARLCPLQTSPRSVTPSTAEENSFVRGSVDAKVWKSSMSPGRRRSNSNPDAPRAARRNVASSISTEGYGEDV